MNESSKYKKAFFPPTLSCQTHGMHFLLNPFQLAIGSSRLHQVEMLLLTYLHIHTFGADPGGAVIEPSTAVWFFHA